MNVQDLNQKITDRLYTQALSNAHAKARDEENKKQTRYENRIRSQIIEARLALPTANIKNTTVFNNGHFTVGSEPYAVVSRLGSKKEKKEQQSTRLNENNINSNYASVSESPPPLPQLPPRQPRTQQSSLPPTKKGVSWKNQRTNNQQSLANLRYIPPRENTGNNSNANA